MGIDEAQDSKGWKTCKASKTSPARLIQIIWWQEYIRPCLSLSLGSLFILRMSFDFRESLRGVRLRSTTEKRGSGVWVRHLIASLMIACSSEDVSSEGAPWVSKWAGKGWRVHHPEDRLGHLGLLQPFPGDHDSCQQVQADVYCTVDLLCLAPPLAELAADHVC